MSLDKYPKVELTSLKTGDVCFNRWLFRVNRVFDTTENQYDIYVDIIATASSAVIDAHTRKVLMLKPSTANTKHGMNLMQGWFSSENLSEKTFLLETDVLRRNAWNLYEKYLDLIYQQEYR